MNFNIAKNLENVNGLALKSGYLSLFCSIDMVVQG